MEEQYQRFEELLEDYKDMDMQGNQEMLIQLLKETQEIFQFIPPDVLEKISDTFQMKPTTISALIKIIPGLKEKYYKNIVTVCSGPRCGKKGGPDILKAVQDYLKVKPGGITKNGDFRLITQNCMKKCGVGPNMMVNKEIYNQLKPEDISRILDNYRS